MIAAPEPIRAWVNPHLAPTGSIGAPRGGGDPAAEIRAAEDWLRSMGCTRARGPLDGSTWHRYRANVGPHDRPLFLGEPDADPAPWLAAGYAPCQRYSTVRADNGPQIGATRDRDRALRAAGWTLQTLDEMGTFEQALDLFYDLSIAAFADNFSYSPIDREGFGALYEPMRPLLRAELVLVARSPEGEGAGFSFAYPDLSNPGLRQLVLKTLAVLPAHRGKGLGSWMVGEKHRLAEEQGFTGGGLHALMSAGNTSQRISRRIGELVREYVLYEKAL